MLTPLFGWCEAGFQRSNGRKIIRRLQPLSFKHRWTYCWTLEVRQGWLDVLPQSMCVVIVWRAGPVAQFTDTLIEIANKTIPKSHISKNQLPKVPWFNDAYKQAIKERKKAQRKPFRNPTAENVLTFKLLKAKARYLIKTQKKTSWQSFCSSFTSPLITTLFNAISNH